MKRYPLDSISALVVAYVLFLLLFLGVRLVASSGGEFAGGTVESLVVGFVAVMLTNIAFEGMGSYISNQAMVGTLEHLYLSPYGFHRVAACRMVASLMLNLLFTGVVLFLIMLTTGRWLSLQLASSVPLMTVIVLQAYALGWAMGGLVLLYKRVRALYQAVMLLMVACIVAPPDLSPLVRLLPFNLEWRMLRDVMAQGIGLTNLPPGDLAFAAVHTAALFALGWSVYLVAERKALDQGLLNQY